MSLKSYRIKNINDPYFKEMWELFTSSFPSVEIRSYEDTEKALEDERFYCIIYLNDENKVSALFHAWDLPSFYYAETLAIHAEGRGQGLGTSLMYDFIDIYVQPTNKPFLLEIEFVCDDYTAKRWRFYERLGFQQYTEEIYMHPSYKEGLPPFKVTVLSYNYSLSSEEFKLFTQEEKHIPMYYSYNKGSSSE